MNKSRTLYDNDGTVVIDTTGISDEVSVEQSVGDNSAAHTTYTVNDALDTLASYLLPRFPIDKSREESGVCKVCGKQTSFPIRKMCVECMEKYSQKLYENAKTAVSEGNSDFDLR